MRNMNYIEHFIYILIMIAAITVTAKGIFIISAKRAVYPGDVFKPVEVTDIRKYNLLNGALFLGLGIIFAVTALTFRYGSTNSTTYVLVLCSTAGIFMSRLENYIKKSYLK